MGHSGWSGVITTKVLSFYRDMERGGKPEFCCVSRVNQSKEYLAEYIVPNKKELSGLKPEFVKIYDDSSWERIFKEASLSLRMNYISVKQWLETAGATEA